MIWVLVHCVLWLTQVWQLLMQGINGLHYMLTCHVQPKVLCLAPSTLRVYWTMWCGLSSTVTPGLTYNHCFPTCTYDGSPVCWILFSWFSNAQLLFSWKRGWICNLAQHFCLFVPSCCLSSPLALQRSCIFCIVSLFSIFSLYLVLRVSPGIWSKVWDLFRF